MEFHLVFDSVYELLILKDVIESIATDYQVRIGVGIEIGDSDFGFT